MWRHLLFLSPHPFPFSWKNGTPTVPLEISLLQLSISVGLTPTPVPEWVLTGLSLEGERVMWKGPMWDLRLESSQRKAIHVKYLDGKDEYIQRLEPSSELWTKWDRGSAFPAPAFSLTMLTVVRYPYSGAPGTSTDLSLLYLWSPLSAADCLNVQARFMSTVCVLLGDGTVYVHALMG